MSRRTVAQLTADLEASHVAYQRLAAEKETLQGEVARLSAALAERGARKSSAYQPRPPSPEQLAFRAKLAAAKAEAIASGRSVRVE